MNNGSRKILLMTERRLDSGAWSQKEMPVTEELVKKAAQKSDKALVVLGRTAGEGKDYEDAEGGYRLDAAEKELLAMVTRHFKKTAVILNVTCVIDMSFWRKPVKIRSQPFFMYGTADRRAEMRPPM
mgnify:CR=1 FL=1